MPFINKDDGTTVFLPPSNEDIVKNRKDIVEIETTTIQKELTKDLQDKISEHARYLVSSSKGIIPFTNRNIYHTIKNLLSSSPGLVDIIVPVYNSIHITQQCLNKVIERTTWPYHLYIVDDCSDEYTKRKLEEFAKVHKNVSLITNNKNKGFAATVNRGIRAGNGQYVCLLNSDVLVTPLWLTKMVLAAKADERNQIVCPATNNTAVVDIPMSQGSNYLIMNRIFERFAVRNYCEIMPTGFNMLFRRSLLEKVGYLDECYKSYGEDDLAIDTPILTTEGWRTVEDIKVGDKVFSDEGRPTTVVNITNVMTHKKCYRVEFDNAEPIIASSTHKWAVCREKFSVYSFLNNEVLTTEELASAKGTNFYIPKVDNIYFNGQPGWVTNEHYENKQYHRIISIIPVHTVPTKCITVDNISHLFLAGHSLVPTHNSQFWWDTVSCSENGKFLNYRAVMADDCYVFHERSSSFSSLGTDGHMGLRKIAAGRFNEINPGWRNWQKTYDAKKALGHLRDKIPPAIINDNNSKYRVCWVVHAVDRCGGMQYIADIVNEYIEIGIDAKVVLIKRTPEMKTDYIGELRTAPIVFEDYSDFLNNFNLRVFRKGFVIAGTVELSSVVRALCDNFPKLTPILHCQSYEPDLVEDSGLIAKIKQCFYLLPNIITNSRWITEELKKEYNLAPFATISPGVDIDMFYPKDRNKGDERPTIMIPVSRMPYRGYDRVLKLIPALELEAEKKNIDLRILLVGVKKTPVSPSNAIALGSVSPIRLATLLGTEVDLLVEPSLNHSYGLPALEALTSGVPVASWENKGIREYADEKNTVFLADKLSMPNAAKCILEVLSDLPHRQALTKEGLKLRETHNRNKLVSEFIEAVEKKFNLSYSKRNIVMVVPHLRKHGGPTTMLSIANELAAHGHTVSIKSLYSDINHEVTRGTSLPIDFNANSIPKCDIVIINSDNPLCPLVASSRQVKRKILLKLSHNPRFKQLEEQGLQQKWDAIVTSSNWLKNVCENVQDGWTYTAQNAHRIGWWHYGHEHFAKDPAERTYGDGDITAIIIGTLIHNHPLKGSKEAIQVLGEINKKYGNRVKFVGIGEIDPRTFQLNLPNFEYQYSPNREQMAELLQHVDIWFGASQTEGLGRLALEAMSAGCAAVISDTNPEYAKNGINCLMFPPGDKVQAYQCLDSVLMNAELRKTLQTQGFRTAREMANSSDCIEELEEVIRGLF